MNKGSELELKVDNPPPKLLISSQQSSYEIVEQLKEVENIGSAYKVKLKIPNYANVFTTSRG